ncbi:MAG: hypothetical protein N2652_03680, partial [Kiritimatiellae bacterium]|nr:hypothetical protein [Kiritimatiellia bacterium]
MRRVISLFLCAAGAANAQVTGIWAQTVGRFWNLSTAWSNNVIPNGVGHWAWLTGSNNLGVGFTENPAIITQNIDVTLGFLIFGDVDRGSGVQLRGLNDSTSAWLTFDTGDGRRALLSHGSGDLHMPSVPGWHYNI